MPQLDLLRLDRILNPQDPDSDYELVPEVRPDVEIDRLFNEQPAGDLYGRDPIYRGPTTTAPAPDPNEEDPAAQEARRRALEIERIKLLNELTRQTINKPPAVPAAAIPDPDLERKQTFERELKNLENTLTMQRQLAEAERRSREAKEEAGRRSLEAKEEAERRSREAKEEFERRAREARERREFDERLAGVEADRRAREARERREFDVVENERTRQIGREQNQLALQRNELARLQNQEQAAHNLAMRELESGKFSESKRQFDISQTLARQKFDLEQKVARDEYELGRQQFGLKALEFLTDLARNPRTALASFFLNRGLTPPGQVGAGSPIPAGLNVSNVAETLPGFLQGIISAASGGASPSAATPSATSFQPANLVSALQQQGVVPPFLSRVFGQAEGNAAVGTNTPQTGAPPEGVPLVSSLALMQMSPSEREGFRGLVEGSGMTWEDYLDLVQRASPARRTDNTGPTPFAFIRQ